MIIHNRFEICCGNQKKVLYNTVLPGINNKFLSGRNYTKYIAFGGGRHTDLEGVTALNNIIGVKEGALGGCNADISKGVIYLKKVIELGGEEYNGIVISEAALTYSENGDDITNYAAVGEDDGIVKTEGCPLTITATIFLTVSGYRYASLCGGHNPLFDILFGVKNAFDCNIEVLPCSGIFSGNGLPRQNPVPLAEPVQGSASVSGGVMRITAQKPQDWDCNEILLTIDGVPSVSYFSKYDYTEYVINETLPLQLSGGAGCLYSAGIYRVLSVSYEGQSRQFDCETAASGAADMLKNPFDIVVKPSDRLYSSECGNYFALHGGDCLYVYDISYGMFKKMNIYNAGFPLTDIQNIIFDSGGNMYVRISSPPYFAVFENIDGNLTLCSDQRNYGEGIIYNGLSEYGGNKYMYYIEYDGGVKKYRRYIANISEGEYSETLLHSVTADVRHYYCRHDGREILFDTAQNTFTLYPAGFTVNAAVLDKLKNASSAEIYGDTIIINSGGKITTYALGSGKALSIYDSGIRRVYYGGGRLIKIYANNNLGGANICRNHFALYPFDIAGGIRGNIADVKVFKRGAVVCADTRYYDCYYIPFCEDGAAVYCPSLGQSVTAEVTVSKNTFKYRAGNVKLNLSLL